MLGRAQLQPKDASPVPVRIGEIPTHATGQFPGNGQTEPERAENTILACLEVRHEDRLAMLEIDSITVVAHLDKWAAGFSGAHRYVVAAVSGRVGDQIAEDLPHSNHIRGRNDGWSGDVNRRKIEDLTEYGAAFSEAIIL